MSIFNKIIDFFKNLFKKDKTKMIEAPQQNVEINQKEKQVIINVVEVHKETHIVG